MNKSVSHWCRGLAASAAMALVAGCQVQPPPTADDSPALASTPTPVVDPGEKPENLTYVCRPFPGESSPSSFVYALVFSPNEKRLATMVTRLQVTVGKKTYSVEIVGTDGGESIRNVPFPINDDDIGAAAWSPDGTHLALACQGSIVLVNTKTGTLEWKIVAHSKAITALAFSSDSKRLAGGAADGLTRCWDVVSGSQLSTHKSHPVSICGLGFLPGGTRVFSCSDDGELDCWESGTGKSVWKIYGPSGATGLGISKELQEVLVGNSSDYITVYGVSDGKTIFSTPLNPAWHSNAALDFSTDAAFAVRYFKGAGLAGGTMGIIDTDSGKSMAQLNREMPTDKAVISPRGRYLAVQDTGGGITIWRKKDRD